MFKIYVHSCRRAGDLPRQGSLVVGHSNDRVPVLPVSSNETRSCSVRLHRLPSLDQVIAIFEKDLKPIDAFGAVRPSGNIFVCF
jgi:hypothetical protein